MPLFLIARSQSAQIWIRNCVNRTWKLKWLHCSSGVRSSEHFSSNIVNTSTRDCRFYCIDCTIIVSFIGLKFKCVLFVVPIAQPEFIQCLSNTMDSHVYTDYGVYQEKEGHSSEPRTCDQEWWGKQKQTVCSLLLKGAWSYKWYIHPSYTYVITKKKWWN